MQSGIINPLCAKKIAEINAIEPGRVKYGDFVSLRTYGKDEVSRMKRELLESSVTESELQRVRASVQCNEDIPKVLRWVKRGLNIDYAIYKVQVDNEVALGAMASRFS